MRSETIILNHKLCHIYRFGSGDGPVILWGTFPHTGEEETSLVVHLEKMAADKDFTVIAYQVEDWNRDFSPWEAPAAFGEGNFAGGGGQTLWWIQKSCIPYIREKVSSSSSLFLAGYSLAGLFSLWAFYETNIFSGVASCSGSLWIDGWDHYMQTACAPEGSIQYLSLGGKEEHTRNPILAKVGDATRKQDLLAAKDPGIKTHLLEWNSGGHFADSGKRVAKGIRWLLDQSAKT